jgi:hypothetical protein
VSKKVFHVGGEVASFADEFYKYSDEVVDEKTFAVRVNNLRRFKGVHASNAAECRARAERFEELSNKYAAQLETLLRIGAERGIKLDEE